MTHPTGRYFEQFRVGDVLESPGRTLTESDITAFAGLSGDYNPLHTDAVYAAASGYGQRIAHGLLLLAIASGLATRTGALEGTAVGLREMSCKFSAPAYIGDTLRVRLDVIETAPLRRLNVGNVTVQFRVINQTGATLVRGQWAVLVQMRPPDAINPHGRNESDSDDQ